MKGAEYVSKRWWCEISNIDETLKYNEQEEEMV